MRRDLGVPPVGPRTVGSRLSLMVETLALTERSEGLKVRPQAGPFGACSWCGSSVVVLVSAVDTCSIMHIFEAVR